jgi:hypothetical protein
MYNPSYHSGLVEKISVTVRGEGEHGGIGTVLDEHSSLLYSLLHANNQNYLRYTTSKNTSPAEIV